MTAEDLTPERLAESRTQKARAWTAEEDARLRALYPAMREAFVDRVLYHYLCRIDRSAEREGAAVPDEANSTIDVAKSAAAAVLEAPSTRSASGWARTA